MAELGETSSPPSHGSQAEEKLVVVRVKRKASMLPLDALWLEINERTSKKPLLDMSRLSLEDGAGEVLLPNTKKLLVQRIETVSGSQAAEDALKSCLPTSSALKKSRKLEERIALLKKDKKQDQLRLAHRKKHEELAKTARFKQIWKSRRGGHETSDESLREICHLYDVVCEDEQEIPEKFQEKKAHTEDYSAKDYDILCNCLPLIREYLATEADDIESYVQSHRSKEEYVYDLYVAGGDSCEMETEASVYPLVQVNFEDDYSDGVFPYDSDSNDSNAEDNPRNEYPEEVTDDEDKDDEEEDDPRDLLSDGGSEERYEDEDTESEDGDHIYRYMC